MKPSTNRASASDTRALLRLSSTVALGSLAIALMGLLARNQALLLIAIAGPWGAFLFATGPLVRRLTWAGFFAVLIQATTLPRAVVPNLAGIGLPMFAADLLALACGVILAFHRIPSHDLERFRRTVLGGVGVIVVLGAVVGAGRGSAPDALFRELLLQLRFLAALVIVVWALLLNERRALRWLLASVWTSGLALLLALTTDIELDGTAGAVDALTGAGNVVSDSGLARYQVAGSTLALFFLVCTVTAYLNGRRIPLGVRIATPPAVLTTALGFSRHSLVALGIGAVVALALSSKEEGLKALIRGIGVLGVISGLLVALLVAAPNSALSRSLSTFGDAFGGRVLSGLTQGGRESDSSLQLRDIERDYAFDAVARSPIYGSGLGAAYRPPIFYGSGDFWRGYGRTYVHDGVLWVTVKLGFVGAGAYALLVARAVRPYHRRRRLPEAAPFVAALIAGLVISFWVPLLLDPRGGVPVAGGLLAIVAWAVHATDSEQTRALRLGARPTSRAPS